MFALLKAGGDVGFVTSEDVAVKAFELYPERFGLIKYPQYLDLDSVQVTLFDLRKEKYDSLIEGSQRKGWRATENGVKWAAANGKRIEESIKGRLQGERRISSGHLLTSEKIRAGRLNRILESEALKKWKRGDQPGIYDFYEVMRVDNYTPERVYKEHLSGLLEAVQDNSDIRRFLSDLDRKYGESYRKDG